MRILSPLAIVVGLIWATCLVLLLLPVVLVVGAIHGMMTAGAEYIEMVCGFLSHPLGQLFTWVPPPKDNK
jgi:hypothetical protein